MFYRIATCVLLSLVGCTVGPKPIPYGETVCQFCSMTIVEKQHAAQLVTTRGKVFNFDAIECLLHFTQEMDQQKIQLILTNTYHQPEALIDVTTCTFLISEGIPSPMGANLTAFASNESALNAQATHSGQLLSWTELRDKYK